MPDFWEFPTVSMGLGPITSLYQARFNRYLHNREIDDTSRAGCGRSSATASATSPRRSARSRSPRARSSTTSSFVVNCNLQRLDGPVRGNGKIIQELEAVFRGAGWNVIKVVWGSKWDALLAQDEDGVLLNKMNTTVDGEFQTLRGRRRRLHPRALLRPRPALRQMVAPDRRRAPQPAARRPRLPQALRRLQGRDREPRIGPPDGHPGQDGQGLDARRGLRGPQLDAPDQEDDQAAAARSARPAASARRDPRGALSRAPAVLQAAGGLRRVPVHDGAAPALDGSVPKRTDRVRTRCSLPADDRSPRCGPAPAARRCRRRWRSRDCCAASRATNTSGTRIVPIIPDEARTFGMDSLFREFGIYASQGQKYEPVDHDLLLSYTESAKGQILEEGITEAGSMASFIAAGTSYATRGVPMVPFYTFYSMFGFQRVGDLVWQAADIRARGFLMGATAGRTTLLGEGLQHQDGHSLVLASTVPAVQAYDPAFAYEIGAIVQAGMKRMYGGGRRDWTDVFYYITLYNENYEMPACPSRDGLAERSSRASTSSRTPPRAATRSLRRSCSPGLPRAGREAAAELAEHYDVAAELWSATSYKALREEALALERRNRLHPSGEQRIPR